MLVILISIAAVRLFIPASFYKKDFDPAAYSTELAEFRELISELKQETEIYPQFYESESGGKSVHHTRPGIPQTIFDTIIIELNQADTLDLQLLKGIGPYYASNILKYRNLLGGYVKREQLLEVYGMDSSRYAGILENIRVDPESIKKLNLNTSSFKSFVRHPYFDYHIVKQIFLYRNENGRIDSVQELKDVKMVSPIIYQKIAPYCTVVE